MLMFKVRNLCSILKAFIVTCLLCAFISHDSYASAEISDIFIESSGNNAYEAEIKAHEQGMTRALYLIASKMGLPVHQMNQKQPHISYSDLENIFSVDKISNEKSEPSRYKANVSYIYDKSQLYNALVKYWPDIVERDFYDLLVIPVLKKGNSFIVWSADNLWLRAWEDSRQILSKYKILYPKKNLAYSKKLNIKNPAAMTRADVMQIFDGLLFKNIMLVTIEVFTNRADASSFVQVKKDLIKVDGSHNTTNKEYNLRSMNDANYVANLVIDEVIDIYGNKNAAALADASIFEHEHKNEDNAPKANYFVMNFDAFNDNELEIIKQKLALVNVINKTEVRPSYKSHYKIIIYTDATEKELMKQFYLNHLTCKKEKGMYSLFDVKKGS